MTAITQLGRDREVHADDRQQHHHSRQFRWRAEYRDEHLGTTVSDRAQLSVGAGTDRMSAATPRPTPAFSAAGPNTPRSLTASAASRRHGWATVNNTLSTAPYTSSTSYVVAFANYAALPDHHRHLDRRLFARGRRNDATQSGDWSRRRQFLEARGRHHDSRPQWKHAASRRHRQSLRRKFMDAVATVSTNTDTAITNSAGGGNISAGSTSERIARSVHGRQQHAQARRSDHLDRHVSRGGERHAQLGR